MRYAAWTTLLFGTLLLSGCGVRVIVDTFCLNYDPVYFGQDATIDWLLKNDRDFLVPTLSNNEKWDRLCN